jgi:hypothetical protein
MARRWISRHAWRLVVIWEGDGEVRVGKRVGAIEIAAAVVRASVPDMFLADEMGWK